MYFLKQKYRRNRFYKEYGLRMQEAMKFDQTCEESHPDRINSFNSTYRWLIQNIFVYFDIKLASDIELIDFDNYLIQLEKDFLRYFAISRKQLKEDIRVHIKNN